VTSQGSVVGGGKKARLLLAEEFSTWITKRKAKWFGQVLRRNCLLQQVIGGKIKGGIEVTGRRGIRRRQLLDDLTKRRGYSHLKEEALDRTMWRAHFGRGFGPVIRQTAEWMNEWMNYCMYYTEKLKEFSNWILIHFTILQLQLIYIRFYALGYKKQSRSCRTLLLSDPFVQRNKGTLPTSQTVPRLFPLHRSVAVFVKIVATTKTFKAWKGVNYLDKEYKVLSKSDCSIYVFEQSVTCHSFDNHQLSTACTGRPERTLRYALQQTWARRRPT